MNYVGQRPNVREGLCCQSLGVRVDLEPAIVMSWNVTSLLGQVPWKPKLVERLSATLLQENYLAELLICTDTRVSQGPDAPHPGRTRPPPTGPSYPSLVQLLQPNHLSLPAPLLAHRRP
jgi:hypothetical protein